MPRGRPKKQIEPDRNDPKIPKEPQPEGYLEVPMPKKRNPTPEGFASRLFHADCPSGKRFVGAEADAAMDEGWVDTPAKLKR